MVRSWSAANQSDSFIRDPTMGGGKSYGVPLFFKRYHYSEFLFFIFSQGLEKEEEEDRSFAFTLLPTSIALHHLRLLMPSNYCLVVYISDKAVYSIYDSMLVDCCRNDAHVSELQDWKLDLAIENSLLTLDKTEFRKSCHNFLLEGPPSIDETETDPIDKGCKVRWRGS